MCLITFAWKVDPEFDLVVAANRDEFHARPTVAAHWWQDPAGLFAGRDLQAGGAWCGMDRNGRFAAVTNVREPEAEKGPRSRGALVRDYFATRGGAADWVAWVRVYGQAFSPFNLIVGDRASQWFVSNRGAVRELLLRPGVYAISNGHWGDHWPKTECAQARLRACLANNRTDSETLFALLADTEPAPTSTLPDTGLGRERERFLSPLFIRSADYGTRASSVIRRHRNGQIDFYERGFDAQANTRHHINEHWSIDKEIPA